MCYENDTRDDCILALTINTNLYINENTRWYFINILKLSALLIIFRSRNIVIKLSLHFYFYDNETSCKDDYLHFEDKYWDQ